MGGSGSFDAGASTVVFDATTARTITSNSQAFGNVDFNGGGGSWELQDALDINGTLNLSNGMLDVNAASNFDVNVAGNLYLIAGSLTAQNGTFTLDGSDQSMNGSWTFHHFDKSVTTAGTLTFEAGSTTTINGSLTIQGTMGGLLGLVSSTSSVDWNIDISEATEALYVHAIDSEIIGTSGDDITAFSSINGGGNDDGTGSPQWIFEDARYWVGPPGGNTSDSANWSNMEMPCGLGGGASVPTNMNTAIFTNSCVNNAAIDVLLNVGALTIESGYSGTITPNAVLDVDGTFAMNDGTMDLSVNNTNVNVAGNFTKSAGTWTAGTGDLILDGALSVNVDGGTAVGNVVVDDNVSMAVDLSTSNLTINTNDTLVTNGYEIDINGTLDLNGTLNASAGDGW